MSRVLMQIAVVFVLLLTGLAGTVPNADAQEASPTAVHEESCDEPGFEVVPNSDIVPDPVSAQDGVVIPFMTSDKRLYVVVLTMPENTCIPFRERDGAVVLFVKEGTIEYTARFATTPNPNPVVKGHSDGDPNTVPELVLLESDVPIELAPNDWITQDRKLSSTFRNIGTDPAVVVVASYVDPPWDDDGCNGGCRKP